MSSVSSRLKSLSLLSQALLLILLFFYTLQPLPLFSFGCVWNIDFIDIPDIFYNFYFWELEYNIFQQIQIAFAGFAFLQV